MGRLGRVGWWFPRGHAPWWPRWVWLSSVHLSGHGLSHRVIGWRSGIIVGGESSRSWETPFSSLGAQHGASTVPARCPQQATAPRGGAIRLKRDDRTRGGSQKKETSKKVIEMATLPTGGPGLYRTCTVPGPP